MIAVDPRQVSEFGAAIICVLFLLQFAHRRKAFILIWAAGSTLLAPAMLLVGRTPLLNGASEHAAQSSWFSLLTSTF